MQSYNLEKQISNVSSITSFITWNKYVPFLKICPLQQKLNHFLFESLVSPKQNPYLPYPKAYLELVMEHTNLCFGFFPLHIDRLYSFHILFPFKSHFWPEIKSVQLFISLTYTKMSCKSTTMFIFD